MKDVSEIGWESATYGVSWIDSRTKGEDELNGWFKNPGLNHWLACSSSLSESDVTINSGPVEFSCVGWGAKVASEETNGKATFMGCTTRVVSSDKEGLLSEAGDWRIEDCLLARFLNDIPKEMFECVALRWYG